MAIDPREANLFFHLINQLYEKTLLIFTSNRGPEVWGERIGDGVEVIHLNEIPCYHC
ncbi:ATP-binding protein [Metabacillus idriensis]|uniref:ATP-binding protein n=1 Tax=Metabacillus idriensis TaxID=324768 RepID=UPI001CD1DE32